MFANRLGKNARHRRKWARRHGVSCYRLYDRDIPEVPLAIDWYEGRLYLARYPRDDEEASPAWLEAMVAAAIGRLEVERGDVFVKERRRQRGERQYERLDSSGARFEVAEGGHRFWVNLRDYLDTGLFLDHRETRRLVAAEAQGKRFLNLFSYTGSFTVYAAAAGATSSASVDLSRTYSSWAADNLALNGIDRERHEIVCGDVTGFLEEAAAGGRRFDLAVVDPPIFSNSKKLDASFDVQRDHAALLERLARVLASGAAVYFSTSRKKFQLAEAELADLGFAIDEITDATIPDDFRQRRPHRAWRLTS